MDNRQVTINTYTSEETNAAIQVQVEAESCYLAEDISKDPFTPQSMVGNQKWECEQIKNICLIRADIFGYLTNINKQLLGKIQRRGRLT